MFGPTLRPALRPLTRVARQFSTEPLRPSSSRGTRTAAITSLTLLVGGVAYSASSRTLRADSRFRESVLDQPSLKENIHPRPGWFTPTLYRTCDWVADERIVAAEGKAVVEEKQHEAESSQQGAFNEETGEINWDCPVRRPPSHLFHLSLSWIPTDWNVVFGRNGRRTLWRTIQSGLLMLCV